MDANRVLNWMLGSGAGPGAAGGLAGALAGGLLLSKGGRKLGKKALEVGGLAAIAGLAYAAWTRHQASTAGGAAAPTPAGMLDGGFLPAPGDRARADELGLVLVRAMVAAAHADGRLDAEERRRLLERIAALDIDARERAELLAEIERPVDLQTLAAAARTPAVALEIYTASRLAIDADTPAERAYLELLAARLDVPAGLAEAVHVQLGGEVGPGPVPAVPPRDAANA